MNETKTDARTCANCACVFIAQHPQTGEAQAFCRRNPPLHQLMRVEVPRLDREGKPVVGKNGNVIMEPGQQEFYLYPPTLEKLVCFDGWRPVGTLPGDNPFTSLTNQVQQGMDRLAKDIVAQSVFLGVDDTASKN